MKFKSKTKQTYRAGKDSEYILAEINFHDDGEQVKAEGKYYVEIDGAEVWTEPINRVFTYAEANALETALNLSTTGTTLGDWTQLKTAASLYELNSTSGFGEWETV